MNNKDSNRFENNLLIMLQAANDPGIIERCEEISKDFEQIDYLEENFESKWED